MKGVFIMSLSIKDYQALATGLTDTTAVEFHESLQELSENVIDFYNTKTRAYNRLNHALVENNTNTNTTIQSEPVNIVGMVDYPNNTITMMHLGQEKQYNLDDLDPRYVNTINQIATLNGKQPERLPITELGASLLDSLNSNVKNKPQIDKNIQSNHTSRKILERAFANEMLFQVNLDEYIKDKGLESVFDAHQDKLTNLIHKKNFEASFDDGMKDLNEHVNKMSDSLER